MDFDFIVTCTVYLALVLFIHMSLKESEHPKIQPSIIKKENEDDSHPVESEEPVHIDHEHEHEHEHESHHRDEAEPELIINEKELQDIGDNTQNNDFMKYLDVEGADTDSTYQKLVDPLQENTIDVTENDSKTDLDRYFTNIKDEQYNFDPVPTKNQEKGNELISDVKSLNIDDNAKDVMAFDEFGDGFASL
mgnify:CR=1 FL=1|tara:strand:- start:209 stop:784 length:576 start_codon:yes stop_codon:yes gene_type:complete